MNFEILMKGLISENLEEFNVLKITQLSFKTLRLFEEINLCLIIETSTYLNSLQS